MSRIGTTSTRSGRGQAATRWVPILGALIVAASPRPERVLVLPMRLMVSPRQVSDTGEDRARRPRAHWESSQNRTRVDP